MRAQRRPGRYSVSGGPATSAALTRETSTTIGVSIPGSGYRDAVGSLRRVGRSTLFVAVALLAVACGDDGSSSDPAEFDPDRSFSVVTNSDAAVGNERLVVALRDSTGQQIGGEDLAATFRLFPEGDPSAAQEAEGIWTWMVPGAIGLYRFTATLDRPGKWALDATLDGAVLNRTLFRVEADPVTPAVGEAATRSVTRTIVDTPLEELTTDTEPDPALYELSVDEALASGRPTVIVFATPKFCVTAACGPMLDQVKTLAPRYPDANWVHVEVYENVDATDRSELVVVPAVREWGLPTEPWVFVTDADGIVAARFEGVMADAELVEALAAAGA